MVDFLGQVIKNGDLVVWPNRIGAYMWMNKGRVLEVGDNKLSVSRLPNNKGEVQRRVTITQVQRVVKVPGLAASTQSDKV